ncbi:MAG: hypothetical protein R6W96_00885 [Clostridia bacterium]
MIKKYSLLHYLQRQIIDQAALLPSAFRDIPDWEGYKADLREKLPGLLPVVKNIHTGKGKSTGVFGLSGNLVLETLDIQIDQDLFAPVYLYRKKGAGISPAVIMCPGYGTPANTDFYVSFAMALAEEGIAAAVVEYGGTGLTADRPDFHTDINNIATAATLLGMNEAGFRVSYNISLFEYLKAREDIHSGKIGITGLCQGAITTAFTVAVEQGFAACAPLCGVTTYEAESVEYASRQGGWTGVSPFVSGILKEADFQHLLACFAPGPMLLQNNITDIHWPLSGYGKARDFIQGIYALYESGDKCVFGLEHAPHSYEGSHAQNILRFFKDNLSREKA